MADTWLITMLIISPVRIGLWGPFQISPFLMAYEAGVIRSPFGPQSNPWQN